ncbi:hypothetical protein HDU67_004102 [Dinochytrium kinnereticum]|nr:hypothetical protein HDU67_004102 [Dinochytrium kinnereticum]
MIFAVSTVALSLAASTVMAATPGKIVAIQSPSSFCLLLPSLPGQSIGESEGSSTSHCVENGIRTDGSRGIKGSAIRSAHLVDAGKYIQITGQIDMAALQISERDGGGQYDDASWGIEPLSSCQGYDRFLELVGNGQFCIRCCKYDDPKGADFDKAAPCFAGNDLAGCEADIPGNYGSGFTYNGKTVDGPGGGGSNPSSPSSPSSSPSPPSPPPMPSSTTMPPSSPPQASSDSTSELKSPTTAASTSLFKPTAAPTSTSGTGITSSSSVLQTLSSVNAGSGAQRCGASWAVGMVVAGVVGVLMV